MPRRIDLPPLSNGRIQDIFYPTKSLTAGVMEYCLAQIYNHPTFFPTDQLPPGMSVLLPNTEMMHEYDSSQHIYM